MKKRIVATLLAAAMAFGLAACGSESASTGSTSTGSTSSSTDTTAASTDTAAAADAAAIDTSEHVVITYMVTGDKPSNTATDDMLEKLNAILTEKVNAELAIYYISWTDYLSVYNLTLAQMDGSVDLVGTATDWLDAWPNVKNGAFLELPDDMLATYAPQTWASVSPEHWDMCRYNGDIYLMPEDNYAQWTNHGFIYRKDWAKEAGLANGCHSWEDMTTYFEYVTANADALGIKYAWDSDGTQYAQMGNGWIASHTDYVAVDGLCTGALWGGTKDDLFTITTPVMTETDSLVAYAEMMKKWDEMGVWPTDVLNNTAAQNRDEYRVGQVAAEQHHTQTWTDLCSATSTNTIYADDADAETGIFYFGEESGNVVALSITHGAMAVSAASKNPERALMVYDLLRNDPECYKLLNYGEEGRQYAVDGNGFKIEADGYDSTNDAITTNWWWGRNDDIELRDGTRNWDAIDALYKEYDAKKIDYPYGQFIPDVDSIQSYIDNCNEVYTNYMKQISFGKYQGSAADIVAEMQAALEQAGIQTVADELQKQMDEIYK